jgi:Zn-dependent peptidase ImmA (M78 family)
MKKKRVQKKQAQWIPSTFSAYGIIWKVVLTEHHPKIKGNFGYCSSEDQTIYILKSATKRQKESTFLHELIHLVGEAADLNLSEHTVLNLEAGLFHILKDNGIKIF